MRILVYGGCHGEVIRYALDRYCLDSNTEFKYLCNFELIGRGEEFPYDSLNIYDVVIFSPILNKGSYNTENIIDYCQKHNIKTISFPWLQWNGYFPDIYKSPYVDWQYKKMIESRHNHNDILSFTKYTLDEIYSSEFVVKSFLDTTDRLMHHENISNTDIKVSDFIAKNYKNHRLFMTPDHPTTYLYRYVISEICKLLDIKLNNMFHGRQYEFQPELRIPILPCVANTLELDFRDYDYVKHSSFNSHILNIEDMCKIIYYASDNTQIAFSHWGKSSFFSNEHVDMASGQYIIYNSGVDGSIFFDGSERLKERVIFESQISINNEDLIIADISKYGIV